MPVHPLFKRPWRELRPIFWGSYVLGPPLLMVLVTPVSSLVEGTPIFRELAGAVISVALGLGLIHALYAVVAPRLFNRPATMLQLIAAHASIVVIGTLIGAELIWLLPFEHQPADPLSFRVQYYRFSMVYAGVLIVVLASYDRMRHHALEKERERDLAAREARLAQLEALQIRTNPHFLFNALNTVAYLVTADPKKAIESIERMSDLFRLMLDFKSDMTIPFDAELNIVRGYLEIEALRYEALACSFAIADDTRDVPVPPLLVQPIVENAIKHGVARTSRPGAIEVRAARTETHLLVRVTNTSGDDQEKPHHGAGRSLELIRRRLSLAYGDDASLEHGPDGAGGYASSLLIPLQPRVRA